MGSREVAVEVVGRGDVRPRVEALQRAKDRLVAAERHPVVVARQGVVPVRVREVPAPAARPPGDRRYRQAEADLQRGAGGGGPGASVLQQPPAVITASYKRNVLRDGELLGLVQM